jgi:hypothetical protein
LVAVSNLASIVFTSGSVSVYLNTQAGFTQEASSDVFWNTTTVASALSFCFALYLVSILQVISSDLIVFTKQF